ncbi:MAG: phosphatidylglycerol lysyltransferase domain-containing protein [Staphylococcus sp.]|nr:phosphatidylglycerol lysyltransferase domain-containing protein [Staphylococcus sp.]
MITSPHTRGFQIPVAVATMAPRRPRKAPALIDFKPMTLADIGRVRPLLDSACCRTCDFTVGGTFMWTDYFDYTYCIVNDTLFIKGVREDDLTRPAFSIPVGRMGLEESVALLRAYCGREGCELVFSAVPEAYVAPLKALGAASVEPLDDWSDYLYDAQALATLSGKKLSKKRNHVNRFEADNPGYTFTPLTPGMIPQVKAFFEATHLPLSKPAIADIEREQVGRVLDNMDLYGFEGAVLSTPTDGIVAFTLGEVRGDTLYTHIEKMNHEVAGAGETVNKLFAVMMTARHPEVLYINREEDVGDPGLRYAKESYHPTEMLRKFNVTF